MRIPAHVPDQERRRVKNTPQIAGSKNLSVFYKNGISGQE
jgi:hypothetical protein